MSVSKLQSDNLIDNIPTNWNTTLLRFLLKKKITDGPHETPEFVDEGYPFLSVDGIQNGELVFEGCRFISEDAHIEYSKKVKPTRGDLLMGKAASTGKIAQVKVDFEFSIWSPLAWIRPNEMISSDFLELALKSDYCQAQIEMLCTHSTQNNISMQDIPRIRIHYPPKRNQDNISKYLNEKISKLNIVEEQLNSELKLLEEKRSALITQTITKGLNPNVAMKDSEIDWIGEIPEHWSFGAIKYYVDSKPNAIKTGPFGSQLHSSEMESGEIKVYNQKNVISQDITIGDEYISQNKFSQLSSFQVFPGDVLVTTRGTIGRAVILPDNAEKGILHPCLLRLQTNDLVLNNEFLRILIQDSGIVKNQILESSNATTIEVIYSGTIAAVKIPVPPISEQYEMNRFISDIEENFRILTQKNLFLISRLKEYRTALISAVVTGKIDVCSL